MDSLVVSWLRTTDPLPIRRKSTGRGVSLVIHHRGCWFCRARRARLARYQHTDPVCQRLEPTTGHSEVGCRSRPSERLPRHRNVFFCHLHRICFSTSSNFFFWHVIETFFLRTCCTGRGSTRTTSRVRSSSTRDRSRAAVSAYATARRNKSWLMFSLYRLA